MWLSESGQTYTILIATSTATTTHVSGARLTGRRISDRHAAARTNGATHQTSSGRSSRMMAVSVRTESGTPSASPAGRRSLVNTVDEVAHERRGRRQRVRRVVDAPGLDTHGVNRTAVPALAFDNAARQPRKCGVGGQTAARRAASSSDGEIAISSDRSGALTNTRTCRRPASSVVENIPKPPPFHGLRPAVLANNNCAHRHGEQQHTTGSVARQPVNSARPPDIRSTLLCSRLCRTACRSRRRRSRSCSWREASR